MYLQCTSTELYLEDPQEDLGVSEKFYTSKEEFQATFNGFGGFVEFVQATKKERLYAQSPNLQRVD